MNGIVFCIVKYLRDKDGITRFGLRLKEVRLEKGFTQEDLAYSCGLTPSQVGRIERGEINTSLSTIFVLVRTLKVDLKYLFDFELPSYDREF